MAFADVAGTCPACGNTLLFLGSGGHVTCSFIDCPDPAAADTLLRYLRPAHEPLDLDSLTYAQET